MRRTGFPLHATLQIPSGAEIDDVQFLGKPIVYLTSGGVMRTSPKSTVMLALLIVAVLLLAGCPPSARISDIEKDPSKYANKDVTISGHVATSYGALGSGMFQIDD